MLAAILLTACSSKQNQTTTDELIPEDSQETELSDDTEQELETESEEISEPTDEKEISQQSTSKIEKIDNFWSKYTNYELGFEINFPTQQDGKDVQIIESNDVVYIAHPDYTNLINQQKNLNTSSAKISGIDFAINIQPASNDSDIENFIQKQLGTDCKLGDKIATDVSSTYKVIVDSSAWNPSLDLEGDCMLNFGFELNYSPNSQKIAFWSLGQDIIFANPNAADQNIAQMISSSFRFL